MANQNTPETGAEGVAENIELAEAPIEEILQGGEELLGEDLEEVLLQIEPSAGDEAVLQELVTEETVVFEDIAPEAGDEDASDEQGEAPVRVDAEADVVDATSGFEELFSQGLLKVEPAAGPEEIAQIEPASGDNGARNGFGFVSSFAADAVDPLAAQGALGGTELGFVPPLVGAGALVPNLIMDDAPVFLSSDNVVVDETDGSSSVTGTVNVDFGDDGAGSIRPNGSTSADGSLFNGDLTSCGEDVVIEVTDNGYVGTANGETVFTFTVDPQTGEYMFNLIGQLDHADGTDPNDALTINFGVTVTDSDGDADSGTVQVTVLDDAPVVLNNGESAIDETNLDADGASVSGSVDFDFGHDGAAQTNAVMTNGDVNVSGSTRETVVTHGDTIETLVLENVLTSRGDVVEVRSGPNGYTGVVVDGDALTPVFDLVVDPVTGDYTFTQYGPLDHGDATDANDVITIEFGVKGTDKDGDSANGTITINIVDDAPFIEAPEGTVDETDGLGTSTSGMLNVDFGMDGGEIVINGDFESGGSQTDGALTSNGVAVVVTQTADGYVGVANGEMIFTMVINTETGEYDFTLLGPLDHADGTDPNDAITLNFGVGVVDGDGNTMDTDIVITVLDDAPEAFDDGGQVANPDEVVTGNVLDNDRVGMDGSRDADGDGDFDPVLNVRFEGVDHPIVEGASTTVQGNFGVLVINSDGSYTYTPNGNVEGTDQFEYTIGDFDGDTDTATAHLSIGVDGVPVIINGPISTVDETDFDPTQTVNGQIDVDFGADGPADEGAFLLKGNDAFDVGGSLLNGELTSQGQEITVTFDGNTAVGTRADGTDVFTITLNDDGSYEFTALQPIDHGDPNDDDDRIEFTFGVAVTDADGDMLMTEIIIRWDDAGLTMEVPDGTVDETDIGDDGTTSTSGDINVDFGADGGEVSANDCFEFSGSATGGALTSNGEPITVVQTGNTYTGTANGEVVFTMTINPDTLDYDFVLLGTLDHADGDNPNDVITLSFGIDAVGTDGTTVDSKINIRVLDDAPMAYDDGNQTANPDEVISGNVTDNDAFGADGAVDVNGDGVADPVVMVCFNGEEFDVTPGQVTTVVGEFGTLTIDSTGEYTYTPLGNREGTDEFQYKIQDADGDISEALASMSFSVDGVPDVLNGPIATVDETDFDNGGNTVSGEFDVDFGVDGPSETDPYSPAGADGFSFGGSTNGTLTTCGEEITVTVEGDSYVGRTPDGELAFELTINDDGTYDFTAHKPLDHADTGDHNDRIELNFDVIIKDFDGDSASTQVTIRVDDDGPSISTRAGRAYERDLRDGGVIELTRDMNHDFGEDGAGEISADGRFSARLSVGGNDAEIYSGGELISINVDGNGYVGTLPNGDVVFTLTVDPETGRHTYTQHIAIDHPNTEGVGNKDVMWLKFGVEITDKDGDSDTAFIVIDLEDAGPVAVDDGDTAVEGDAVTGNIFANDEIGPDVDANPVTKVTLDGVDYPVSANGNTTIEGQFGTLVINSQGQYTYTPFDGVEGSDNFTYMITDGDGDSDAASFSFTVSNDDVPVITGGNNRMIDESADRHSFDGRVTADFGDDGPGTFALGDPADFTFGGSTAGELTSCGEPITVSIMNPDADRPAFVGRTPDGAPVFQLKLEVSTGRYWFSQFGPLDHADGFDPNDLINLVIPIVLTDADGDSTGGVITVGVKDDAPVAVDDEVVDVADNAVTGDILANDDLGFDGSDGSPLVSVTINGVEHAVNPTGDTTINGEFGVLTINAQGQYTYTAADGTDGGIETMTYTIEDKDGDTDTGTFGFNVSGDDAPEITGGNKRSIDESADRNSLDGRVTADYGDDAAGDFKFGDLADFTVDGVNVNDLTSGGEPVELSLMNLDSTRPALIGTVNGEPVFQLKLDVNGRFWFTRFGPIDHLNSDDPDDVRDLGFPIIAFDDDGDATHSFINICIHDDGPVLGNQAGGVNEDSLVDGDLVAVRKLAVDYGEDGAGRIEPTGTAMATFEVGGQGQDLTSNGVAIVITQTANGYIGLAGGETIFTVTMDDNGRGVYTQMQAIDHPNDGPGSDRIWLKFQFSAFDNDGDSDNGWMTIDIQDGTPTAVADQADVECDPVVGNVMDNDALSGDVTTVVRVFFNGEHHDVDPVNGLTLEGEFGTFEIAADGAYTYTPNNNVWGTDTFNYTLQDFDGDRSVTSIKFDVENDNDVPSITSRAGQIHEIDLLDGDVVVTRTIEHDFGDNGAGEITTNGVFMTQYSVGGPNQPLTSGGLAVTVTSTPNGYVGTMPDNSLVFTLTIDPTNGTHTFTLMQAIDHPNTGDGSDVSWLKFGVEINDGDDKVGGDDSASAFIIIDLHDSNPDAVNDGLHNVSGEVASGNILDNDVVGADDVQYPLTHVLYNGGTFNFPQGAGQLVIQADYGTLIVNTNGDYTYTPKIGVDGTDQFTYFIQDRDGDTDFAGISFEVENSHITPLVFDLDGDGIEFANGRVGFDMTNDGINDQTNWVGADDGLLVIDTNGNGTIDDQSELFGNDAEAADGFEKLSRYDSNGDGVFDADDDAFGDVQIWQDANQDGVSQDSELYSLTDMGIASIDLDATETNYWVDGNGVSHESTYTDVNGVVNNIADVWFMYEQGEVVVEDTVTIADIKASIEPTSLEGFSANLTNIFEKVQEVFDPAGDDELGDQVWYCGTAFDCGFKSVGEEIDIDGAEFIEFSSVLVMETEEFLDYLEGSEASTVVIANDVVSVDGSMGYVSADTKQLYDMISAHEDVLKDVI